jgi:hypothetical protein
VPGTPVGGPNTNVRARLAELSGAAAPLGAVRGDLRPELIDKPEADSGLLTVALESGGGAPPDARLRWKGAAQLLPQRS